MHRDVRTIDASTRGGHAITTCRVSPAKWSNDQIATKTKAAEVFDDLKKSVRGLTLKAQSRQGRRVSQARTTTYAVEVRYSQMAGSASC
jgi:hypothetical protein